MDLVGKGDILVFKRTFWFVFAYFCASVVIAQPETNQALPFPIADVKRLDDEDLKNKKEGTFVTGIPQFSSDPINGQGVGVDAFVHFNGKKSDPLFPYTPYKAELGVHAFKTNKNTRMAAISLDMPYFMDTKWRIRGEAAYEVNPNLLYFGSTAKETMKNLNYHYGNNPTLPLNTDPSYNSYSKNLKNIRPGGVAEPAVTNDRYYNRYQKGESILNLSAERSFLESKMRVLGGFEAAKLNINTFENKWNQGTVPYTAFQVPVRAGASKLQQDYASGKIHGAKGGFVTIAQVGLVYDTRDLEPDPSRGIFAEITDEYSSKAIGSDFDFNKVFAHVKYYHKLFPNIFDRLILATRWGLGMTTGKKIPFFELQDEWGSEGSIEGLGGMRTLRGYKQSRFLGPIMSFGNIELRYKFFETNIGKQHFAVSIVPFTDFGRVWDHMWQYNIYGYKHSYGAGLRIAWNQSTIIMLDYAVSKTDEQLFFGYDHIF